MVQMIVIGADTHKRTHALAAVDEGTGRVRAARQIKAEEAGHLAALRWARELDDERVWAIEDCRGVSGRLEQALIAAGEQVVRVAPHRMGASRRGERRPGKSDEIDALAIARAVVKDGVESFPAAHLDKQAMEIRLLSDHRKDLVAERTRVQNRLRWHLLELCGELEQSLRRGALDRPPQLGRIDRCLRVPAPRRSRARRTRADRPPARADAPDRCAGARTARARQGAPPAAARRTRLRRADRGDPDRPHRRRRAVPQRRELRPPGWHRTDPVLLRPTPSASPGQRRRPPTQLRATRHRDHPSAL